MRDPCLRPCRGSGGAAPPKSGAHRHAQQPPTPRVGIGAWRIGPGRIPGAPKVPHGGAAMCTSATSGVRSRGGTPPNPCLGGNILPRTNHGGPRGTRWLKSTGIGVVLPPAFRPPGPDLFMECCRAKNSSGAPVAVKNRYSDRYKAPKVTFRIFPIK